MPLESTITCDYEYQCYDKESKTCILSTFEVIPAIMPTRENEKYILVIEKSNDDIS